MREFFLRMGLFLGRRLALRLGRRQKDAWGARVGRGVSYLARGARRAVSENLAAINAAAGTVFQVSDVFGHFGRTLADFLSDEMPPVRVEGREKAESARAAGRGVIILTSHLGSWELGGKIISGWGWDVTAVYQPYRSKALHGFIQRRRAAGMSYTAVGRGAAATVGKALRRGGAVALLGDKPFGEEGVEVPMFGRRIRLARGPFLMACRHGAAVLPGFILRDAAGAYRCVFEDPLWPQGRGPEAVRDLIERTARIFEKYLSQHGDQWYCFDAAFTEGNRLGGVAPSPGV